VALAKLPPIRWPWYGPQGPGLLPADDALAAVSDM